MITGFDLVPFLNEFENKLSNNGGFCSPSSPGVIAVVGNVVRQEKLMGLWKGMTPVSKKISEL